MNIYLDIDGVLLVNEQFASNGADEFLQSILNKYPDSTYWLTTHCWRGENRAVEILTPVLKPETIQLLAKVKPTQWGQYKTDAIDFSQPFMWFDDDLFDEERSVLVQHDALDSLVAIDLHQNPNQLRELLDKIYMCK